MHVKRPMNASKETCFSTAVLKSIKDIESMLDWSARWDKWQLCSTERSVSKHDFCLDSSVLMLSPFQHFLFCTRQEGATTILSSTERLGCRRSLEQNRSPDKGADVEWLVCLQTPICLLVCKFSSIRREHVIYCWQTSTYIAHAGYTTLSNAEPPLVVSKDEGGMTFESTDLGRVMAKWDKINNDDWA